MSKREISTSDAYFYHVLRLAKTGKIQTETEIQWIVKYFENSQTDVELSQVDLELTKRLEDQIKGIQKAYVKTVYVGGPKSKVKITAAPGYKTLRMLRLVCSKKFVERELEQIHSDAIFELCEAEKAGDKKLAWMIPWRLRVHLLTATASGVAGWFLSKVRFNVGSGDK